MSPETINSMQAALQKVSELLAEYGLRLVGAIAIYVFGRWASQVAAQVLERSMHRAHIDATLATFLKNVASFALLIFVIIAALGQIGIQTTSIVALIGAAGLAIGLAVQGSLSNFAAGVLMVVFRPFRVGDFIEAAGTKGTVAEIQIFHTALTLNDRRRQIVPNAAIMNGTITIGTPA